MVRDPVEVFFVLEDMLTFMFLKLICCFVVFICKQELLLYSH